MFKKYKLLAALLLSILAFPALADQAAYIQKEDAIRAMALLSNSNILKSYCAPCGEQESVSIPINTINIMDVNFEGYWEVQINNEGIDLAYSYFFTNNKWRNVAISLGLPVVEVPEFINY